MPGKAHFNPDWTNKGIHPEWAWLRAIADDVHSALCLICNKKFSLSNMGIQAIKSHAESKNHKKKIKDGTGPNQLKIESLINKMKDISETNIDHPKATSSASVNLPGEGSFSSVDKNAETSGIYTISSFVDKENVLRAEAYWAMRQVMTQSSYNSSDNDSEIFKKMFPDSDIAKKFSMGRTKNSYLVSFGLGPYFDEVLRKCLLSCEQYVVCFDEALNKISQRGQMDIHLRFWNEGSGQTVTRYFQSVFMGHAKATDVLQKFKEGLNGLQLGRILQVSMDGPNTNWSFYGKLKVDLEDAGENLETPKMLELGSCGLHVVHGALQTGHKAVGWKINAFLRGIYYLFKDTPARRADYTAITGSTLFPHKFCQVRWVENVDCAERSLAIFSNIKNYVSSSKLPSNISVENVKKGLQDPLMECRLAFFKTIAADVEPFLRKFQSPNPLGPFLYHDLMSLVKKLMRRFIKANIVDEAVTMKKLLAIDISEKSENLLPYRDVDVGFGAAKYLGLNKCVGDKTKGEFKMQCARFLSSTVAKILERSPLKYNLTRGISAWDPKIIIDKPSVAQDRVKLCLTLLHENNRISEGVAEKAKQQFSAFLTSKKSKEQLKDFNENENRLDQLYHAIFDGVKEYKDLWSVTKIILILSHGNASVEGGFSINKNLLVENLHEHSLVALRQVYDGVSNSGGLKNIVVDSHMIRALRGARARYHDALNEKKMASKEADKLAQSRKRLHKELKELKGKKSRLNKTHVLEIEALQTKIQKTEKDLNDL